MTSNSYSLHDLPDPLNWSKVSSAANTAKKCELTIQVCLSCGHEFESDSLCACPVCESAIVYSVDTFFPDTPKTKSPLKLALTQVKTEPSKIAKSLSLGLVPALLDKISAYSFTPRNDKEAAVLATNWKGELFSLLRQYRDFAPAMLHSFVSVCDKRDYFEALQMVEAASNRLHSSGHNATMSESSIRELAAEKAQSLARRLSKVDDVNERFKICCDALGSLGLGFDEKLIFRKKMNSELHCLVNRALDELWLSRQLRLLFVQNVDNVARDLALVHKHKQAYCSDFAVNRYKARKISNAESLERTMAVDTSDYENAFTLAELSEKSISNEEVREAELFVRLKGFEEIAFTMNHGAIFTTLTAPSRFHSVSNGAHNPKWIEAGRPTSADTHLYLIEVWTAFRKLLDKAKIKIYGMRIGEPHHDGTPHHHHLLFGLPKDLKFVEAELRRLALKDSPEEKGAQTYRFKSVDIDPSKGSAVGYVAKYLCKNINGKHIDKDEETGASATSSSQRVVTWARTHGLRQFQFIGGPSVTAWRELRNLREEIKEDDAVFKDLSFEEHHLLETVRKAADSGCWAAFCVAMGGVFVKRNEQAVRVHYAVPATIEKLFDDTFGPEEVIKYSQTRFGDKSAARINGIMFQGVFKATRFVNWEVMSLEQYKRGAKKIMTGTVDVFDALERQHEYERMAEAKYEEYERYMQESEDMQALIFDAMAFEGRGESVAAP
ncbi:Bacteriophage replication gene A protein (GPA) [Shewanella psychrophila]|uniref:Bacteriophage replication gene A protein (GPA) n=1 Tax=Shewanella psychrophila TaxID=225848 RepID=A0A1S6HKS7_9GAMM|nr:replication endonuclease [Shewanella psychrophila]AQS36120.1 Bacteriophage replication gene A protein (GPA) [Shewanella psychrophila]